MCHCHLWLRTMVIHQNQAFDLLRTMVINQNQAFNLLRTVIMNLKNRPDNCPGVEEGLSYSPVCVCTLEEFRQVGSWKW